MLAQQGSTKAAATPAAAPHTTADEELPYWAKAAPAVHQTHPVTPEGGTLTQRTTAMLVQAKPKAAPPTMKARLPMPKRPLATQRGG
eukprot:3130537-Amphidinium_carterae.1